MTMMKKTTWLAPVQERAIESELSVCIVPHVYLIMRLG
jgi:hypothetical protein